MQTHKDLNHSREEGLDIPVLINAIMILFHRLLRSFCFV